MLKLANAGLLGSRYAPDEQLIELPGQVENQTLSPIPVQKEDAELLRKLGSADATFASRVGRGILDVEQRENSGFAMLAPAGASGFSAPASQVEATLLDLSAKDPSCRPQLITLSFDCVANFVTQILTVPYQLYAILFWGTGKGQQQAIIDLKKGTRVTLEATTLMVSARYLTPGSSDPARIYPSIGVGCSVVYESMAWMRNTFTPAPFTLAASAQSAEIPLPPYAREAVLCSSADPFGAVAPTPTLDFFAGPIFDIVAPQKHYLFPGGIEPITIPNGVDSVAVLNDADHGSVDFLLSFILNL